MLPLTPTFNANREVVIAQLVANSPAEGPAEDATKKSPSNSTGAGAAWGSGGGDIESAQPLITRLDEGDVEPFSLCAHCLVDKCGAHHCNVRSYYLYCCITPISHI